MIAIQIDTCAQLAERIISLALSFSLSLGARFRFRLGACAVSSGAAYQARAAATGSIYHTGRIVMARGAARARV